MSLKANWNYPTAIRFGAGRIAELGEACKVAGITRPLFVTDPGIARLPIAARVRDLLAEAGFETGEFSDVQPNPTEDNVAAGLKVLRDGDHDGVVAFGGGSALDCGKVVAFMRGQTRPMWDFEDVGDWWTRADPSGIVPIVAVPTTAGTGSEVGRAGVITNVATHTKKVIFHPGMMPAQVICDAELTVGLPPALTAGTGMDAFAHCLEAYCSPGYHPMAEGIAVEGMRLVQEYLPRGLSRRHRSRGPRQHARGGGDGSHGLPEGPRRDPCALAPGRRALRHAPRHDQRGLHALCAGLQPRGALGQDRPPRRPGSSSTRASPVSSISCCVFAATSAFRTRSTSSAWTTRGSTRWRRWRSSIRPRGAIPRALTEADARDLYERALEGRVG